MENLALALIVSIVSNLITMMIVVTFTLRRSPSVQRCEEKASSIEETMKVATDFEDISFDDGILPEDTRSAVPDQVWPKVVITPAGYCYHREGCYHIMMGEKDARKERPGCKRKFPCRDCIL